MRRVLILALVAITCFRLDLGATHAAESRTYISGGSISQPVRLAAADEDAFYRRLNVPPRLDEAPDVSGPSYTIRTPYWAEVMPGAPGVREPAGEEATYYSQGGYVRSHRSDGTTTWLVLDTRQQAIIARYIRLGEKDLISPFPGVLQVLKADALAEHPIGVQMGTRQFSDREASEFWQRLPVDSRALIGVDPASPIPLRDEVARPHELPSGAAWLLLTPPEGRTVELLYRSDLGLLYDLVAQQAYAVPTSFFESVLGTGAGLGGPATAPVAVPQDEGPGSPVWWLAAAGIAAALLAGALGLRRATRPAT